MSTTHFQIRLHPFLEWLGFNAYMEVEDASVVDLGGEELALDFVVSGDMISDELGPECEATFHGGDGPRFAGFQPVRAMPYYQPDPLSSVPARKREP